MVKLVVADAMKPHGRSRARRPTLAFAIFLEGASTAYAAGETVSMNTIDANGVVKKIGTLGLWDTTQLVPNQGYGNRPILLGQRAYYSASELILRRRV